MKVSVVGAKPVIEEMTNILSSDGALGANATAGAVDKTEQKFGLFEAAAVIAIVANSAKLIEYLIVIGKKLGAGEKQRLQLKTAVGTATVEVSNQADEESLKKQVSSLGLP